MTSRRAYIYRVYKNPQVNRKNGNYCSECGRVLNRSDKARMVDYGFLVDIRLCRNCVYEMAKKYLRARKIRGIVDECEFKHDNV